MAKPSYEELERRIRDLEADLAAAGRQTGEARLREQLLTSILDNTNLPIYLKDASYRYLLINREFERLAHCTNDQIYRKDDFAVFPEPIARLFREQDEKVVKCGKLLEFTETIQLADGEHTFITAKFPLVDEYGLLYAVGGVCTDITALEQTQATLKESEYRYRTFIENFHGIAYRAEIGSPVPLFMDGAVEKITGYTENEFLLGKPCWKDIVHPDDQQILPADMERMCQPPAQALRREYRIVRKDGGVRWIFERTHSQCDEAGQPRWLEGSLFDITGRKATEEALRLSEEQYRSLVDTSSAGIQISDREGRIILSNPAHQKMHQSDQDEIVGKFVWDFIDDETERNRLKEYYAFIIDQQPEPTTYRTVNMTPDGREMSIQVDWNYMRDRQGEVTAICSIITDITARVEAEKSLSASEFKVRSVLDSCPEGIHMYTLRPNGDLIFTGSNQAADNILGVDHSEFIGLPIEKAFPALIGTDVPRHYREVCATGREWQVEQFAYKDERIEGAYEVHAFRTGPNSMASFFKDITAKRQMEAELMKVQKLESVGVLAGGIAHDFNNLLTAILGNISMARLFAVTDPVRVEERLIDAENASIRARDLTQQLLTFSKGGAPVKSAARIDEVIRDSTSFMLSGSNVRCDITIPDDVWPVNIDIGQISQVIQNVVKNADQAMPEGGTIGITADNVTVDDDTESPLNPGRYVHIAIHDQGVGIPAKHLDRIFDPYFTTKQDGSGLGLAAAFSIINNHDGTISAESETGAGATFHIHLPASGEEPALLSKQPLQTTGSGERILVMDDDPAVLKVAVTMLQLMGYQTETASDGKEAVAKYGQALSTGQAFDAVILDLTIPGGMGGMETLHQLFHLDGRVKAIVTSGYANDPIMADYAKHGFQGVMTKPYDLEQLGRVLRTLFD